MLNRVPVLPVSDSPYPRIHLWSRAATTRSLQNGARVCRGERQNHSGVELREDGDNGGGGATLRFFRLPLLHGSEVLVVTAEIVLQILHSTVSGFGVLLSQYLQRIRSHGNVCPEQPLRRLYLPRNKPLGRRGSQPTPPSSPSRPPPSVPNKLTPPMCTSTFLRFDHCTVLTPRG